MYFSFLALILLWQIPAINDFRIWIENNELWVQTTGRPRQLSHHGQAKGLPSFSPDSRRIIYLANQPATENDPVSETIVEVDPSGKHSRTLIPDGYVPRPFDRLEWIDSRRIGAMACGHTNCIYWILDANSGKTLKTMQGGFDFVWSHNAQWVARRFVDRFPMTPGQPYGEGDRLTINETQLYPPANQPQASDTGSGPRPLATRTHIFGPFSWSPHDAWLTFTDTISSGGDSTIVLVSPTGKVLHDTVAANVRYDAGVDWIDDTHLQITTDGRTFSFVVDGDRLLDVSKR